MYDQFKAHLRKRVPLTDQEFDRIASVLVQRRLRRGHFLFQQGEIFTSTAFVVRGCLRKYSTDANGEEHVVQFAVEDWWIGDMYSALTGKASMFSVDALEDSEILLIDQSAFERLFVTIPMLERFFRLLLQSNHIAVHQRLSESLGMTAEERYLSLERSCSGLADRIPLKHIASFLGITPQSLSRIRRGLVKKR